MLVPQLTLLELPLVVLVKDFLEDVFEAAVVFLQDRVLGPWLSTRRLQPLCMKPAFGQVRRPHFSNKPLKKTQTGQSWSISLM